MRIAILAFAALAAPVLAASAAERMTDVDYMRANRCVAYAGAEAGPLAAIVKTEGRGRHEAVFTKASEERREIARRVNRARTPEQQQALAAMRKETCAPFESHLVQTPTTGESS